MASARLVAPTATIARRLVSFETAILTVRSRCATSAKEDEASKSTMDDTYHSVHSHSNQPNTGSRPTGRKQSTVHLSRTPALELCLFVFLNFCYYFCCCSVGGNLKNDAVFPLTHGTVGIGGLLNSFKYYCLGHDVMEVRKLEGILVRGCERWTQEKYRTTREAYSKCGQQQDARMCRNMFKENEGYSTVEDATFSVFFTSG